MRPGHFWVCELGDYDGKGSPVIHKFTGKNESFELSDGRKVRGDAGDWLLLIRRYYHRTVDDTEGLTFVRWQGQEKGVPLVINSSELRAVQGWQKCDIKLVPPRSEQQRASIARSKKRKRSEEVWYDVKTRWRLEVELDRLIRSFCEAS